MTFTLDNHITKYNNDCVNLSPCSSAHQCDLRPLSLLFDVQIKEFKFDKLTLVVYLAIRLLSISIHLVILQHTVHWQQ